MQLQVTKVEQCITKKNGVKFAILTLSNGVRIKMWEEDWSELPQVINTDLHAVRQPPSFMGSNGTMVHQLPVLRRKSNAMVLESCGFTVIRPPKPQ